MAFFLGIDGGGSKTTCMVGDETSLLATSVSGGSNIVRLGEKIAGANLTQAIRRGCAEANVQTNNIAAVCVGMAGSSLPEVAASVRKLVGEVVACPVEVAGDMTIAMQAAFGNAPGVIVVAGTGSIAYGRNQKGRTARAGGWGFAVSDEGSGHWIGHRAVQAVLDAHDSAETTALTEAVLGAWRLHGIEDLVRMANSSPPPDFASLFPHVQAAAGAGDTRAHEVLTAAASELGRLCETVIDRLWDEQEEVHVATAGGVFANSPLVRRLFQNSVQAVYPKTRIAAKIVEPAAGALAMARKQMMPNPGSAIGRPKSISGE